MDEDRGIIALIRRMLTPESGGEVAAQVGASMVPGVGAAMDAGDVAVGIADRDAARAGWGILGLLVPGLGGAAMKRGAGAIMDRYRNADRARGLDELSDEFAMMAQYKKRMQDVSRDLTASERARRGASRSIEDDINTRAMDMLRRIQQYWEDQ